jgi:hypothetical protein
MGINRWKNEKWGTKNLGICLKGFDAGLVVVNDAGFGDQVVILTF